MSKEYTGTSSFYVELVILALAYVVLILAFATPVFQVYTFMKTGIWTPLSAAYGVTFLGLDVDRSGWIGFAMIMRFLPLSVFAFFVGIFLHLYMRALAREMERQRIERLKEIGRAKAAAWRPPLRENAEEVPKE